MVIKKLSNLSKVIKPALLLLALYHFCPLLCPSLVEMFPWYFQFSWRDLYSSPFYCFPLFLCIVHWRRPSCLFLLFFRTLNLVGYKFPFLPFAFHLSQIPRRAVLKNVLTIGQLLSSPILVRSCLKFCMLGFSVTCTKNFQMSKLGWEKAEESEMKL